MSGKLPPLAPPSSPVTPTRTLSGLVEETPFKTPRDSLLYFVFPDDTQSPSKSSSLAGRVSRWEIAAPDVYAMLTILSSAYSNLGRESSHLYGAWKTLEAKVIQLAESNPQEAFAMLKSFPFTHEGQTLCACTKTLRISNSNSTIDWSSLSPQVWDILTLFTHLEQLHLFGISLNNFPPSILPSLKNLHTLRVTDCIDMKWLPYWLPDCKALQTLDLRLNALDQLPPIHLMPNLKHLYMHGNIPFLHLLSLRAGAPTQGPHRLNGLPLIPEQEGLPPFNHKEHLSAWTHGRDHLEPFAEANFPQLLPFPIGNTQIPLRLCYQNFPLSSVLAQLDTLDLGLSGNATNLLILKYNKHARNHNVTTLPFILSNMNDSILEDSETPIT